MTFKILNYVFNYRFEDLQRTKTWILWKLSDLFKHHSEHITGQAGDQY